VDTDEEDSAPNPTEQGASSKRIRRGAKYIGKNGAHLPGVPAADLTWAEMVYYFGSDYGDRRSAIEVRFKHLYGWNPPKEPDHKPEDDE
jgi:hypothetical protein